MQPMTHARPLPTGLDVVRVFLGPDGGGGNLLGVFLDGSLVPSSERQAMATRLGYPETVYVDSVADGAASIAIFTPTRELAFAGHPTVGTSGLLRSRGFAVDRLIVPAGEVEVWQEGELAFIRARAGWGHEITAVRYDSPAEVDAMTGAPDGQASYYAWAWIDEAEGIMRSRYFAASVGIQEDEATGLAAVEMGHRIRRAFTIRQGVGSELYVRPGPDGTVEVGGRCASSF